MLVETTHVTEIEYYFACTRGRSPMFCHKYWQSICSFRAVNVALAGVSNGEVLTFLFAFWCDRIKLSCIALGL